MTRSAIAVILMLAGALVCPVPPRAQAQTLGSGVAPLRKADLLRVPLIARPDPYQPYQHPAPAARLPLAAEDVARSLKARGFVDVTVVRQRGRNFLCEATGPRGERVRLVVDAASAEISGMQVIGYGKGYGKR